MPDLLDLTGLSRSTYYYHEQRLNPSDKDEALREEITQLFGRHKQCYGYRRITYALKHLGRLVNKKKVQRLMQELNLRAVIRRRKGYSSYRGAQGRIAPNVLERLFESSKPNEKWVTDVTEFKVGEDKLYLSPIMDLYNREIVAYELMARPQYDLVGNMLNKALSTLGGDERPLVHSDQGWQYQLQRYQKSLAERGLQQSMSRKGNCLDNAVMENFFGTLKCELFYREKFKDIEQLAERIHEYIDYYNHERISSKLKGLSPVQYRNQSYN